MSVSVVGSDFKEELSVQNAKITGVHESLLQESEKDIIWYRDNFLGKAHKNFLATDSPIGPIAVSLIGTPLDKTYKALVRSTHGSERLSVSFSAIANTWWRNLVGLNPPYQMILNGLSKNIPVENLKACLDPNLPNEMLTMEERQVIRSYKFGVGYLAQGQSTEAEMMSNKMDDTSPAYRQFLNFLGETIELNGWKGYRAGLDVTNGNTGVTSVYTKWQGYEVMYHVSTMLPYSTVDKQQLERKRHIGNDIVIIVFQDDAHIPFNVSSVGSHQNHVFAVVTPHTEGYNYTPELPNPVIVSKEAVGRDFFLHKLVNGERASYKAPSFASKISRTRTVLLFETASKYIARK